MKTYEHELQQLWQHWVYCNNKIAYDKFYKLVYRLTGITNKWNAIDFLIEKKGYNL